MNIVLSEVIYYALFKHKIILDTKKILLYLPTDAFGVFVTIRRPPPPPPQATAADIHGCIGYWKESFEALSPTKLYDHLLRVAYAAVWTDHRRSYFKVPLAQDSLRTFVEVDFMLQPPYLIDTDTGLIPALANEPFRNEKYGLLLQSPHGRARATYLPKVFLNTPWPTILASLKHKAGLNGGGGGDFHVYAYRIQQVTAPLVHLLTHKTFAYANLCNFARFMLQHQMPNALLVYARTKEGVLQWNSRDKVRNLATTSDVLKYAELFPLLKAQYHPQLADLRHHITHILAKTEAYSAQALSFLASHVTTTPVQQQAQYCRKLYAEVAAGNAVFAQPEIIIGLQKAQCTAPVATAPLPILTFGPDDSIFKMNWVIQALTPPIPPKLILILIHKVMTMTMTMTITTTETNYLAVAFEALCFAFTQKKQKEETQQQMLSLMFELIFELEQRKHACCLYGFLDHSARVDITTHVNNGLYRGFLEKSLP